MVYEYNIFKFDFFNTVVADILRAIDGDSLMGSFILSFCCIDYMGMGMNLGKQKNTSDDFKSYVKRYMGRVNPRYAEIVDVMWAVRNSLIHVYGISDALARMQLGLSFSYEHPENHLQVIKAPLGQIWFNLPEFVGELVASIELFFRDYKENDEQLRQWYSKLITVKGAYSHFLRWETLQKKDPEHKRSHNCFDVLNGQFSIEVVREAICSCITKRLNRT